MLLHTFPDSSATLIVKTVMRYTAQKNKGDRMLIDGSKIKRA